MPGQEEDKSQFQIKGKPNIDLGARKEDGTLNLKIMLEQKIEEAKQKQKEERKIVVAHPGSEFKPENTPYIPDSTHPLLDKHNASTIERNAGFQDRAQVPKEYLENIKPASQQSVTLEITTDLTKHGTESPTSAVVLTSENEQTEIIPKPSQTANNFSDKNSLGKIGLWYDPKHDEDKNYPRVEQFIDHNYPPVLKKKVLDYLALGVRVNVQMGFSQCRICGKDNGCAELTDTRIIWPEGLSHYIKDHDVRIKVLEEYIDKLEKLGIKPSEPEFKLGISRENMNKGGFFMPNEYRPYKPGS